jgi:bla regulator protein blaR1
MTAAHLVSLSIEAAVLATLVALACRWGPRIRAGHRAMLWWLVSAKLLVGLLPLPSLQVEALSPERAVERSVVGAAADSLLATPILSPSSPGPSTAWVAWGWIAIATLLVASAAPGWRRARSWRASGRSIDDASVRLSIAAAARVVGLRREPLVLAVSGLSTPLVTGLLRPCVLVPADVLRLPAAELEMTLAHEMAHVARGDLWWGLVPSLARRVFFFHPAAWLAEREYAIAREAACDEAVLRPGADAFAYGRLLLRFAARAHASTTIPMSPHSMLRRRIEMIETVVRRVPGRTGWVLVAVAALALVPIRIVAQDKEVSECLSLGDGEDTAYVVTNGRTHVMCGDAQDAVAAERARGGGEDVIWFRQGGNSWIIRDLAAVREGRRYFDAMTELNLAHSRMDDDGPRGAAAREKIVYEKSLEAKAAAEVAEREQRLAQEVAKVDAERAAQLKREAEVRADHDEQQRQLGRIDRQREEVRLAISAFLDEAMKDGRAQRAR